MRCARLIPLLVLAFALPCLASPDVYRWKDANGTVHFADAPPPNGVKYKIVNLGTGAERDPTPPPAPAAAASTPDKAAASGDKMADTPENRAKLCQTLEKRIAMLQSDQPLTLGADSTEVISPEQRAQELATSQEQQKQYCP